MKYAIYTLPLYFAALAVMLVVLLCNSGCSVIYDDSEDNDEAGRNIYQSESGNPGDYPPYPTPTPQPTPER